MFLKKVLETDSLFDVLERFYRLQNTIFVFLSKGKFSTQEKVPSLLVLFSHIQEICRILNTLVDYHCKEKLVQLLTIQNSNPFSDLFELEDWIYDSSSLPFSILLGTHIYHSTFHQNLSGNNPFLLYDFMNQFSFEEREEMNRRFKHYARVGNKENMEQLKSIFLEIAEFRNSTSLGKQRMILLSDELVKKSSSKKEFANPQILLTITLILWFNLLISLLFFVFQHLRLLLFL